MKFSDRTRKMWPFNTGDCLIDMTAWAGFTVHGHYALSNNVVTY